VRRLPIFQRSHVVARQIQFAAILILGLCAALFAALCVHDLLTGVFSQITMGLPRMNAYFKANEMFAMTSGSEPFETRRMSLPKAVIGPLGEPLTLESLPPANCKRWVPRRKAEVVAAVSGGLLTVVEASTRYGTDTRGIRRMEAPGRTRRSAWAAGNSRAVLQEGLRRISREGQRLNKWS
jgi:hypothetical protein